MIRLISLIALSLFFISSLAQEKYDVANIPASLLSQADVIVRNDETKIIVRAINDIWITRKYAVTILKEEGQQAATFTAFYDKFIKLDKIKGTLYDDKGYEIRRSKNSEIKDKAIYEVSFFDDNRIKEHEFYYGKYPYTVAYEFEQKINSLFMLDDWEPQDGYNRAIENATIEIEHPVDLPIKHKAFHISNNAQETSANGYKNVRLTVKNLLAIKKQYMMPYEEHPFPTLAISADTFILENVSGSMHTWKSFGKFYYELNKGRDGLPEKTKKTVHTLTDTCTSNFSKISVLYDYLKNTTRYVSIQLGIGGWQSFDANFVAEKGYGDCKALSNYMKAILQEIGINAFAVLVRAGSKEKMVLHPDFSCNSFNHVILCVPEKGDTVWLECTAKTLPAGYLSDFTEDRDVLIISAEGGSVVHTPKYTTETNFIKRSTQLYVNDKGEIEGNIKTIYSGEHYNDENYYHHMQPKEKTEKHLNSQFNLPSYKIKDFQTSVSVNKKAPQIIVYANVIGTGNIMRSGKRIFVKPEIADIINKKIPQEQTRSIPFALYHSSQVFDTCVFVLTGTGFKLESIPEESHYTFPFGEYYSKYYFDNDNKVKVVRSFKQKEGTYPATAYPDYIKLLKEASIKESQNQVVLLKND